MSLLALVTLVSIGLLIASMIASISLWIRTGETRLGLFGGLFLVFAAHQAIELWTHWGSPFRFDASAAAALAGVIEGLLSIAIVVALRRTLGERDSVETIHWDSMEVVRIMNELSADRTMAFEEKVPKLLEMAAKRFELEVAVFARIVDERYEVIAVQAPADFPISADTVCSVEETFCASTLQSDRPVAVEHISESPWNSRLDSFAFPYAAYLGAAVRVNGAPYGTLSFGGREPRTERFTATDKDLVVLMAQWLATALERRDGVREPGAPVSTRSIASRLAPPVDAAVSAAPQTPTREAAASNSRSAREPRVLDVNRVLKRAEKQLRAAVGRGVALQFKLDPGLEFAAVSRLPLDAIMRTLVMNATDAMAGGGELIVETANLELTSGEPGVIPAVAPDRYVTISVRDTGAEPDADTLSRLYEPAPSESIDLRDPENRLSLPTLYRVLQSCGGDLSVDVERGRGSTFTVYLPRAKASVSEPRVFRRAPPPTLH